MKFSLFITLYVSLPGSINLDREFILETYETPKECGRMQDRVGQIVHDLNLQYVTVGTYCVRNVGKK